MAGATPLGNMVIKLGLDDADFGKGVANSKKQVQYLAKEMQANMKVADLAGNKLGKLGTRYDGLTQIIKAQENQVTALKKAYDGSFVDGKATDSTKRLANQLQDANGKLANYKLQLQNTAGAIADYQIRNEGLTGSINKASDVLINNGKRLGDIGSSLTKGLTVPIAAGVTAVTAAAISWESAFAGVKKTSDEVVDSNGNVVYSYDDLEASLRNLANELPSTHSEIAAVAEAAGQLGIQTDNVSAFTKVMIDLGESTNMSAETAATELARFANITQMSQDKFSNLGSALVDLGNNFATTESEISAMALRLAGAGAQIGMSEGDILGFAAALSSVGIEAEAGGSAFSKVMVNMQLAVEKGAGSFDELKAHAEDQGVSWERLVTAVRYGGKELTGVSKEMGFTSAELKKMYKEADNSKTSLEQFADVAGMTGDKFAEMFKSNPSEAIMKFVEGLGKAEEQGSSAISVLDDMGITEVRLRDSLLRAANASGVFAGAVEMGNKAFGENTALAEEAGKRYETTESKLKMLRNEAVNAAIDLGGPFVDALRDGLESSKPLIKQIGNLAEAFSNADPKTQQMIVKLIAATAAAGPLLSITGKLSGTIGGLGKSFIDLSANMAKKKAIDEVKKSFIDGDISANDFLKTLAGGSGTMTQFGAAASGAAGSGGIGAMTAALGPLGPLILGIVGVGGALAVGYGAWKLFGEEAWNSSQRVQRWGEDVTQATDTTLSAVQDHTNKASGTFNLMAQGFDTDTASMVSNFQLIGSTIENDLTNKLEAYKTAVDLLPTELQEKASQILDEKADETQKVMELVKANNEEVLRIKQQYVDKDGEITIQGAKMVQDLMTQSAKEYLNIAITDADARREVMSALTGDVETATAEQAEAWIKSLAQQRQQTKASYTEDINDYRSKLEKTGQLNKEEIDMLVGLYEDARETSTDALDAQMALLVQKYPELAEKISLANGQMIDQTAGTTEAFIAENQKILENSANLSAKLSENAKKNAKSLAWTADQTTKAGKTWNDLELLDKDGNVKTNATEIVTEATKDIQTWNDMKVLVHDANLDSNAKKVIGEAAIANGYWDGMAWSDKEAVLQDEFSITMYKVLDESGKWDELSLEAKTAFLYSNTPEVMAETMLKLGLWDEYQPEIKDLDAKNYNFLNTIKDSEEKMKNWDEIPDTTKELYADNYDLLTKIYSSDEMYGRFKELPDSEKKFFGENDDLLFKILNSETSWKGWQELPDSQKNILLNNEDLMTKVFASEESLNAWKELPDPVKHMLGNNEDILAKVQDGTISVEDYNKNVLPTLKKLFGDNSDIIQKLLQGESGLNTYNGNNPAKKILNGDSSSAQLAARTGGTALDIFARNNPARKYLNADDNASSNAFNAREAVQRFINLPSVITKTLKVATAGAAIGGAAGAFMAEGTNFHKGGDMIVNDQPGPLYKEIVHEPGKEPYIPVGRNVLIPNAKRGTKVYKASRTKSIMRRLGIPKYADGVGIPEDSLLVRNLRSMSPSVEPKSTTIVNTQDYSDKLDQLIAIMSSFGKDLRNVKFELNRRVLGDVIIEESNRRERTQSRGRGIRG
ncbi:phage tail tape measure protein, TP901 family, core region [Enterococcus sp. AZ141]|uniref:phage tail tape measure protein n=1 Tax=Enterococcus sp. AZ141 TaxID=2774681 RepID=UPI003F26CCF5